MARHKLLPTEEIFNMYESGMTMEEIAKIFECAINNISYHVNKQRRINKEKSEK